MDQLRIGLGKQRVFAVNVQLVRGGDRVLQAANHPAAAVDEPPSAEIAPSPSDRVLDGVRLFGEDTEERLVGRSGKRGRVEPRRIARGSEGVAMDLPGGVFAGSCALSPIERFDTFSV